MATAIHVSLPHMERLICKLHAQRAPKLNNLARVAHPLLEALVLRVASLLYCFGYTCTTHFVHQLCRVGVYRVTDAVRLRCLLHAHVSRYITEGSARQTCWGRRCQAGHSRRTR